MTQFIRITTRKAELELCDCPKAVAEMEFRNILHSENLSETKLADLEAKVKGAVLIQDAKAHFKYGEANVNLEPYFFIGEVILAKKSSEGYELLDEHDIAGFFDWFHGLEASI